MDNEYIDTTDNTIDFGSSSESIEGGSNPPGKSDAGMTDAGIRKDIAERMEYMIFGNESLNNYIKGYTIGTPNGDMIQKYKSMIKKQEIKECINIFKNRKYNRKCAKILNDILDAADYIRKNSNNKHDDIKFPIIGERFARKYKPYEKNMYNDSRENNEIKEKLQQCETDNFMLQNKLKSYKKIYVGEKIVVNDEPFIESDEPDIGEEVEEDVNYSGGSSSEENKLDDYDSYNMIYNRNKAYYLALKNS